MEYNEIIYVDVYQKFHSIPEKKVRKFNEVMIL